MKASLPYKYITSVKNGKHYVVFDYKDHSGKRKRKWVNTELPERCSKKALKEAVDAIVAEFDKSISSGEIAVKSANAVPYAVMSDETTSNMLLDDFFSEWLTYIKPNVPHTFAIARSATGTWSTSTRIIRTLRLDSSITTTFRTTLTSNWIMAARAVPQSSIILHCILHLPML